MGGCGALLMEPDGIADWAEQLRAQTNGSFQMNLWIPDPAPHRDAQAELRQRNFVSQWGPPQSADAANPVGPDFSRQCDALLAARPTAISSIMGLYPAEFVERMKAAKITWFATVTSVTEALAAESAGADVLIAQGMEAGGHRGAFDAADAEQNTIGLFSLLPAVVDAVQIPVVATGGIADARTVAAALLMGAVAVQLGTALLRTPEAAIAAAWADAIGAARPEHTVATRAFSGRLGRSVNTAYVKAASSTSAPPALAYPLQRSLTAAMRAQATRDNDIDRIQAWAGQSAAMAQARPATDLLSDIWRQARGLLEGAG